MVESTNAIEVPAGPLTGGPPAPPPAVAAPLGDRTARGLAWLVGQTVALKVVSLAAQVALARLLRPQDFGMAGLAFTVTAFAGLLQQAGLREVLLHRGARFQRWENAAFWMSLAAGGASVTIVAALTPLAAVVFHSRDVGRLILVAALAFPFDAIALVPLTSLQNRLYFRTTATLGLFAGLMLSLLSMLFAWRGCGPYSFVLPRPIVSACTAAIAWSLATPRLRRRPQLLRWQSLFSDSGYSFGTSFFGTLIAQGDYLTLGLLRSKEVLGVYYFAFNLSTQALQLLANNLASVLLPSLGKLQSDPQRQTKALLRAVRLISFVVMPASLLQAALAGPIIRIMFGAKWQPSVPVLQVLSIGLALAWVGSPAATALQAQGRFRFYFWWSSITGIAFLSFAITGGMLGGAVSMASFVTIFYVVFSLLGLYLAIRPTGGTWRDIWTCCIFPFLQSAAAVAVAATIARRSPFLRPNDWSYCVTTLVASLPLYSGIVWVTTPEALAEVWVRLVGLIPGRLGMHLAASVRLRS